MEKLIISQRFFKMLIAMFVSSFVALSAEPQLLDNAATDKKVQSKKEEAPEEKKPASADDKKAPEEKKPVAAEDKKAPEEKKPASADDKKAPEAKKPVTADDKKAPEEKKPVAEDKTVTEAKKPVAAEDKKAPEEKKPVAAEDKKAPEEPKATPQKKKAEPKKEDHLEEHEEHIDFLNEETHVPVKKTPLSESVEAKHEKMIKDLEAVNKQLTDRLNCLEHKVLSDKKSDYKGYGRIGDSDLNVNFSGNINMFSTYYPGQKHYTKAFVTDPRYIAFDGQHDSNNNFPAQNKNNFGFSSDGSTLSTKIKKPTKQGDFFAQFDVATLIDAVPNATTSSTTSIGLYIADAHVEFMNFTVGYTYSNFSDPNSLGSWLNVTGIQESNLAYYPLSVQYTIEMTKNVALKLSVESPIQDGLEQYNYSSTVVGSNAAVNAVQTARFGKATEPAFVAQILYTNDSAYVSLRLMERKLEQKGNGFDLSGRGYGVGLSGKYNVQGKSNVYFQTAYGKGIGSYIGELTNYGFLCDLTTSGNYKFELLKAYSFLIGTQVYIQDNIYFNIAYQQNGVKYPDFATRNDTAVGVLGDVSSNAIANLATKDRKYMANIVYELNEHFKFGLECTYAKREILNIIANQKSANATTLTFAMKYFF
ncbi:MAG: hypothetical protein HEEMFOPI_00052 [Holosporales bacterium]